MVIMNRKNSEFSELIKSMIDSSGKEVLSDKKRVKNLLNDLAPGDKFAKEKKLLDDAYSCNAIRYLLTDDTSEDNQKKAVASAQAKLMDSYIAESGANLILKDICDALGWDTQKLFPDKPVQQVQARADAVPGSLQDIAEKPPQVTEKAVPKKKRSCLGSIVKVVLAMVVLTWFYNAGKNAQKDDIATVDRADMANATDTSMPVTTLQETTAKTSAEAVAAAVTSELTETIMEIYEDEIVISESSSEIADIPEETSIYETTSVSDTTTVPETVTETETTTTADPREGKYVVTDIARVDCSKNNLYYDNSMTYDSNENALYYIQRPNELRKYSFADKSDIVVITIDNIIDKLKAALPQDSKMISDKENDSDFFSMCGVEINRYTGDKYALIYAEVQEIQYYGSVYYYFIYDIQNAKLIGGNNDDITTMFFINENEYFRPFGQWWKHYFLDSDKSEEMSTPLSQYDVYNADASVYRVLDINDNYYLLSHNGDFKKFENIYTLKWDRADGVIFNIKMTGAYLKDNMLYYKDDNNNVYKVDVEIPAEEPYITVDQIFQNGKQFIGDGECTGLYITNDGGFVTYDQSDNKIKYVSMN